jgi:hypothetical protein
VTVVGVPTVTEDGLAVSEEHVGAGGGGALLKLAVTVCGPVIAITQAPVPLQSPPQPPKKEEALPGAAASETAVPIGKLVVQKPLEQLNPNVVGLVLVTVPAVPVARPTATVRAVCPEVIVAAFPANMVLALPVAVKVEVPVVMAVV